MAIGDPVGALSVPGVASETFTLTSNPGNLFAISGSEVVQAVDLANGNYTIGIQATGPGRSITSTIIINLSQPLPPSTDGPMDFSVPGNLPLSPAGAAL